MTSLKGVDNFVLPTSQPTSCNAQRDGTPATVAGDDRESTENIALKKQAEVEIVWEPSELYKNTGWNSMIAGICCQSDRYRRMYKAMHPSLQPRYSRHDDDLLLNAPHTSCMSSTGSQRCTATQYTRALIHTQRQIRIAPAGQRSIRSVRFGERIENRPHMGF